MRRARDIGTEIEFDMAEVWVAQPRAPDRAVYVEISIGGATIQSNRIGLHPATRCCEVSFSRQKLTWKLGSPISVRVMRRNHLYENEEYFKVTIVAGAGDWAPARLGEKLLVPEGSVKIRGSFPAVDEKP